MSASDSPLSPTTPASSGGSGSASPPAQLIGAGATNASSKTKSPSKADGNGAQKVTKRRAARACVSCRARKVRCDVVEGAPCGNCRWDNVECVVQESRRRRRHTLLPAATSTAGQHPGHAEARASTGSFDVDSPDPAAFPGVANGHPVRSRNETLSLSSIESATSHGGPFLDAMAGHVPHLIYQRSSGYSNVPHATGFSSTPGDRIDPALWSNPLLEPTPSDFSELRKPHFLSPLEQPDFSGRLPAFVKPLPAKIAPEDVAYLHTKGALTLPGTRIRDALLRAYVEYVHPYMPLLELHDFLEIINAEDGICGQVSLLLYQAVMFAGTAFVDAKDLRAAGFTSRRAARRAYFQRTRLLYDFDYESDRLILVQSLLLMTYWYETPDDQKDTWHWMGVAISLAHTIGLHRNPANTTMPMVRQKLCKRIWWSCFMRDRLVALGMRRPTRIKDEDFDVPMLTEADFDIEMLSDQNQILGPECTIVRDIVQQQELATMCVEKARLCMVVSHLLKTQYSMLNRDNMRPENTTNSTMMLFPTKAQDNSETLANIDAELVAWHDNLPAVCQYQSITGAEVVNGRSPLAVQRTLLHMIYQTAISALHRPQFLPSSPLQVAAAPIQVQEVSRLRVREAAAQVTMMAADLRQFQLERFLPTTGVTVILPAMIIHLLDMKSPFEEARQKAMVGFAHCLQVLEKLREIYAAADFAIGFLHAALKKASIDVSGIISQRTPNKASAPTMTRAARPFSMEDPSTPPPDTMQYSETAAAAATIQQGDGVKPVLSEADALASFDWNYSVQQRTTAQEIDSAMGMTPSASASSEEAGGMDLDYGGVGQAEFDWNAVGSNLDFDQWLQFPAEGVNNSDGSFVNMFEAS